MYVFLLYLLMDRWGKVQPNLLFKSYGFKAELGVPELPVHKIIRTIYFQGNFYIYFYEIFL